MLRIALTKGRLEKNAAELFEKAGYDVSDLSDKEKKGRKLLFELKNAGISIVLAKAADVITYVEHGVCDMGITGKDTIMETGRSFYEVLDLKFGKCRFALAGMNTAESRENFYGGYSRKIIATKYPNVTKKYSDEKGFDAEIVKIEGSVELAPILNLAGAIVDIVETGSTLKENGLEIYEEIAQVSARVIVNRASIKLKKTEVNDFIKKISGAIPVTE